MPLDPKQVEKPVRKLRKIIKNISRQPSPEDVHRLRTNARRLEATLFALELDSESDGRRLLKSLSQVRKRAGKVRDMDVLTSYAARLSGGGDEECRVELLEHLGAKRRKTAGKLYSVVSKHRTELRSTLKQVSSQLDRLLEGSDSQSRSAAPARATAAALVLESELANVARLGRQNLHPYRLKVKELRNVLRMAKNSGDKEFIEVLGRVKDVIGEWHDWQELSGIASKKLDHNGCNLIRELQRKTAEKYDQALAETEIMRRKYLGVSRGKKRGAHKFSEPAWTATRDMAA